MYYDYATGSNIAPVSIPGGELIGGAVYGHADELGPADVFSAGGLSPYGTMGQGGNVWEWTESADIAPNDLGSKDRTFRGGSWFSDDESLGIDLRLNVSPSSPHYRHGFRVAAVAVPEPTSVFMLGGGGLLLLLRKKRKIWCPS